MRPRTEASRKAPERERGSPHRLDAPGWARYGPARDCLLAHGALFTLGLVGLAASSRAEDLLDIVIVYADDVGIGDLSCDHEGRWKDGAAEPDLPGGGIRPGSERPLSPPGGAAAA